MTMSTILVLRPEDKIRSYPNSRVFYINGDISRRLHGRHAKEIERLRTRSEDAGRNLLMNQICVLRSMLFITGNALKNQWEWCTSSVCWWVTSDGINLTVQTDVSLLRQNILISHENWLFWCSDVRKFRRIYQVEYSRQKRVCDNVCSITFL